MKRSDRRDTIKNLGGGGLFTKSFPADFSGRLVLQGPRDVGCQSRAIKLRVASTCARFHDVRECTQRLACESFYSLSALQNDRFEACYQLLSR